MTMSKLLEKVFYTRIYHFLKQNNILYESQFGFHCKHSCEQAVSELVGRLLQANEQGEHAAGIFLDLSKAFSTLKHQVLLAKME